MVRKLWENLTCNKMVVVTGFSSYAESNLTRDGLKDQCLKVLCLVQGHNNRREMESAVRAAAEQESLQVSQRMNVMSENCQGKAPQLLWDGRGGDGNGYILRHVKLIQDNI